MASLGNCEVLANWKKVVLTVEEKLEIIELLHRKTSYTVIAEKYGIGRLTITDIRLATIIQREDKGNGCEGSDS